MQTNSFEQNLPIEEKEIGGKLVRTVSARDLHKSLESNKDFTAWVKNQVARGMFDENIDYMVVWSDTLKGVAISEAELLEKFKSKNQAVAKGWKSDYIFTIEAGKHIALMSGTKKGKEVRNYFIRIEETFLQLVGLKSKSEAEMHLFKNLDNINLILKDMDTMNSVFEKLETAHKFLNTKNILELYRMDKFTQKIMNFSIFEVFGIDLNEMFFIPTELGKILDKSAVEINKILEHKGYQIKVDEHWELTENGKEFAISVKNKLFTQIKWKLEAVA